MHPVPCEGVPGRCFRQDPAALDPLPPSPHSHSHIHSPSPQGRRCSTIPPFRRFPVPPVTLAEHTHTAMVWAAPDRLSFSKWEQARGQRGLPLSEGP